MLRVKMMVSSGWLLFVIVAIVELSLAVCGAPQQNEKTADLTLLINETLKINNKPPVSSLSDGNQSFRDDWTFDRVEYDLMDFLQELNARYQKESNNKSQEASSSSAAAASFESELDGKKAATIESNTTSTSTSLAPTVLEETKKEKNEKNETLLEVKPAASPQSTPSPLTVTSLLPVSIATGDHDISESTWQYGIFDRFTRARVSSTSTTTQVPPDSLLIASSGASLDVRSFNSDECGLRSYRDSDYFSAQSPQAAQFDTDEITKELSQRRQRPPLSSGFFSSHKKFQASVASSELELDRDKLLPPPPPFDRYGESTTDQHLTNTELHRHHSQNYSTSNSFADEEKPPTSSDTSADSEFNLSSRRQWLQQQLGSTLQLLGFNSSQQLAADFLANQTHSFSALNMRENMMKMSAASTRSQQKMGKSVVAASEELVQPLTVLKSTVSREELASMKLSGPEVTEKELKARQDELKLEARVIGGNDARLGDSPWSVSLQALVSRPGTGGVEYRHYCGGTIISEYYILTAAHCLDFMVGRESRLFVVVGDLNWRMSAASMYGRRFGIEKLIIHGGYKSTAFGHDIGLIRTKESMRPLKVNGRYIINSVCLPERNVEHSGEAELVGWGLFSNRNEMADSLQIADVPILPRPLCVDLYRRRTGLIQWLIGIELITEKQICAGTFGRGICQGDSGSALVFNEKATALEAKASGGGLLGQRLKSFTNSARDAQQRATIIGVVAFGGIRRCSYQSLPGVYMQTSKYLDWILPRIQP